MVAGLDIVARKTIPELAQRIGKTTGPTTWSKMVGGLSSDARKVLPNHFTPQQLATLSRTADSQPDKVGNIIRAVNDNDSWGIEAGQRYADGIQSRETSEIRRQPQSLEPEQTTDPAIPADQAQAEDWVRVDGGRDQRLKQILTVGRDSEKYGWKKGYVRSYEELPQADKDLYDSMLATRWGDLPETYKDSKASPEARTAELAGTPGYKAPYHKSLEFHHKNMKVLVAAFHRKMAELRGLGKAVDQDIIDLHRLDDPFGMESGSREAAALRMHRATHSYMHKEVMLKWHDGMSPIQPSHIKWKSRPASLKDLKGNPDIQLDSEEVTKALWSDMKKAGVETKEDADYFLTWAKTQDGIDVDRAIKKFKQAQKEGKIPVPDNKSEIDLWKERIAAAKSPNEVKELYQEMLEAISEPMTKEAELMERVAKNQFTPEGLLNPTRQEIEAARTRQLDLETDEYGQPKPQEVTW